LADRITPRVRHLDCRVTWLHQVYMLKHFVPVSVKSSMMLADVNTKPFQGDALRNHTHRAHGVRFYPPPDSRHYIEGDFKYFKG
jgi:hypothetical protein